MWLLDTGIIDFCHNLSAPELPLEGHAKSDVFKVYMRDTGLLMSMLDEGSAQEIIDGNLGIYKGAIYENIVADIFTKSGKARYYFERDANPSIESTSTIMGIGATFGRSLSPRLLNYVSLLAQAELGRLFLRPVPELDKSAVWRRIGRLRFSLHLAQDWEASVDAAAFGDDDREARLAIGRRL